MTQPTPEQLKAAQDHYRAEHVPLRDKNVTPRQPTKTDPWARFANSNALAPTVTLYCSDIAKEAEAAVEAVKKWGASASDTMMQTTLAKYKIHAVEAAASHSVWLNEHRKTNRFCFFVLYEHDLALDNALAIAVLAPRDGANAAPHFLLERAFWSAGKEQTGELKYLVGYVKFATGHQSGFGYKVAA